MTSIKSATIHPTTNNLVFYGRLAWPAVFAPSKMKNDEGSEAKYQVSLLLHKGFDYSAAKTAATEAATKKFGETKAKSAGLRTPFRKSEEKDQLAELAGDFPVYITARSKDKPGVVGPNGKTVDDPEQVYSGRWAKVSVQPFGYDTKGNKGVSFGLQNVQLLDHDDPLALGGARVSAEAEFEAVEGVSGADGKSTDNLFN